MKREDFGENWDKYDALMQQYCDEQQVPWTWMKCIALIESSLGRDPNVAYGMTHPQDAKGSASYDGKSWGLMQLRPEAAKDFDLFANPERLNCPEYSIHMASKLLRRLYRYFEGEEEWVIKSYNEGLGNARKERAGEIEGNSSDYWDKYLKAKEIVS